MCYIHHCTCYIFIRLATWLVYTSIITNMRVSVAPRCQDSCRVTRPQEFFGSIIILQDHDRQRRCCCYVAHDCIIMMFAGGSRSVTSFPPVIPSKYAASLLKYKALNKAAVHTIQTSSECIFLPSLVLEAVNNAVCLFLKVSCWLLRMKSKKRLKLCQDKRKQYSP